MGNVTEIKAYLNAQFLEREAEVEAILSAVLAKQHTLLIGPAGTGKSALASELHRCIEWLCYFQWLLTKFSMPEEVFGPLSLAGLERDEYVRNIERKLPTVHLAFLDEIFKLNSAVLNALLTLIKGVTYMEFSTVEKMAELTKSPELKEISYRASIFKQHVWIGASGELDVTEEDVERDIQLFIPVHSFVSFIIQLIELRKVCKVACVYTKELMNYGVCVLESFHL